MHAGLGAQPTIGVFAPHFHAGALDAGHFPGTRIDHLAGEAAGGAPAQVHTQQHLRPVLRLGAAGARLDVEKRVVRVHLAAKHAFQLQVPHLGLEALRVALDVARGALLALRLGQFEELGSLADALGGAVDLADVARQASSFTPELLRARRVRPDGGILQLARNFLEPLLLAVVLKETPVAR